LASILMLSRREWACGGAQHAGGQHHGTRTSRGKRAGPVTSRSPPPQRVLSRSSLYVGGPTTWHPQHPNAREPRGTRGAPRFPHARRAPGAVAPPSIPPHASSRPGGPVGASIPDSPIMRARAAVGGSVQPPTNRNEEVEAAGRSKTARSASQRIAPVCGGPRVVHYGGSFNAATAGDAQRSHPLCSCTRTTRAVVRRRSLRDQTHCVVTRRPVPA